MAATARVIWLCACVRYWLDRGLVFECVTCFSVFLFCFFFFKIDTLFQDREPQNPYPIPRHIPILPICGSTNPQPPQPHPPAVWGHNTRYGRTDQRVARENRPVRQLRVRSETAKDKPGDLPPAVYAVHHTERLRFPEENNVSLAMAVPRC